MQVDFKVHQNHVSGNKYCHEKYISVSLNTGDVNETKTKTFLDQNRDVFLDATYKHSMPFKAGQYSHHLLFQQTEAASLKLHGKTSNLQNATALLFHNADIM